MSKFEEIYNKVMENSLNISDDEREFIDFENLQDNYKVITEDTFCILNEYVSDPELTPVPKEVLNFICSKVKYRRDNVTIISMKEIYDLLREYEYPFYQGFKNNLKTFNGNLYIVMLFDRDYQFLKDETIVFNKTYLFINQFIKDNNISKVLCKELLKEKHRFVDAFCSKTDNSLKNNRFFQDNGLIFVSLKGEFIKDSLEHELTHFVQKTVGFKKVHNAIKNNIKLNDFEKQNKRSFQNLYTLILSFSNNNSELSNYLLQFFSVKFKSSELHQSVKAVLNGFQRIYEYNKFGYVANLDNFRYEINKAEANNNKQFRQQWLKIFLSLINDEQFIKDNIQPIVENLMNEIDQQQYLIKYRPYFIILLYLGFKQMFPTFDIDHEIQKHFLTFKFKDN